MCIDGLLFIILLPIVAVAILWTPHSTVDEYMSQDVVNGYITTDEFTGMNETLGPNYGPVFDEVISPYLWYSWFKTVVLPFYWDSANPNEEYPAGRRLAGGNVPVGPVRLSVLRNKRDTRCFEDPFGVGPDTCLTSRDAANTDKDQFGALKYEECEDGFLRGVTTYDQSFYGCQGNVLYLPTTMSFNNATDMFNNYILPEDGHETNSSKFPGVVDLSTATLVMIRAITYNIPTRTFTTASFYVQINKGGNMLPNVFSVTYTLNTTSSLIVHIILMAFLGTISIATFVVYTRRGDSIFGEFWNYVWITALVLTITYCALALSYFSAVIRESSETILYNNRTDFSVTLDRLGGMWTVVSLLRCYAAMLFAMIIVRYISLIPQVQKVASGIDRVYDNIIGLLFLLLANMAAFCMVGFVLFGQYIYSFQSIPKAFTTLSLALIGNFDLDGLLRFGVVPAQLFYWCFVLSNLFILLNFLAATIGSSFEEARTAIDEEGTESSANISEQWSYISSYFTCIYYAPPLTDQNVNTINTPNSKKIVYNKKVLESGPTAHFLNDSSNLNTKADKQLFEALLKERLVFAAQYMLHLDSHLTRMIQNLKVAALPQSTTEGMDHLSSAEYVEILVKLPSGMKYRPKEKLFIANVIHDIMHMSNHDDFYRRASRDNNHNPVAVKVFNRELDVDFPTKIHANSLVAEALHAVAHAGDDLSRGHHALHIALTRLQHEYKEAQLNAALRQNWDKPTDVAPTTSATTSENTEDEDASLNGWDGNDTFYIQIASKTPDYTKVSKSTMNFIAAGGIVKPQHLKTVGGKFEFSKYNGNNNSTTDFEALISLESAEASHDTTYHPCLQRLIEIGRGL
jgi:hypothetical protein